MNESKELLEATIKGLEEKLDSLNTDLRSKQRELADVNKPVMTDVMFDQITDLVDDAVRAMITVYDEDDKMYEYDRKQYEDDPKKLLISKPFQDMVKILQEKNDA